MSLKSRMERVRDGEGRMEKVRDGKGMMERVRDGEGRMERVRDGEGRMERVRVKRCCQSITIDAACPSWAHVLIFLKWWLVTKPTTPFTSRNIFRVKHGRLITNTVIITDRWNE